MCITSRKQKGRTGSMRSPAYGGTAETQQSPLSKTPSATVSSPRPTVKIKRDDHHFNIFQQLFQPAQKFPSTEFTQDVSKGGPSMNIKVIDDNRKTPSMMKTVNEMDLDRSNFQGNAVTEVFENAIAQTFNPINITQIFSQAHSLDTGLKKSDYNEDTLEGVDVELADYRLEPLVITNRATETRRFAPVEEFTCISEKRETIEKKHRRIVKDGKDASAEEFEGTPFTSKNANASRELVTQQLTVMEKLSIMPNPNSANSAKDNDGHVMRSAKEFRPTRENAPGALFTSTLHRTNAAPSKETVESGKPGTPFNPERQTPEVSRFKAVASREEAQTQDPADYPEKLSSAREIPYLLPAPVQSRPSGIAQQQPPASASPHMIRAQGNMPIPVLGGVQPPITTLHTTPHTTVHTANALQPGATPNIGVAASPGTMGTPPQPNSQYHAPPAHPAQTQSQPGDPAKTPPTLAQQMQKKKATGTFRQHKIIHKLAQKLGGVNKTKEKTRDTLD